MWICNLSSKVSNMNKKIYLLDNIYQKHKKSIVLISCVLINTILFGILIFNGNPIFATNDDYRMRLIVSGEYNGMPSNQAIFLNIVLSSILSKLYLFNPHIEWYGCYFELGMYIATLVTLYIYIKGSIDFKNLIKKYFIYLVIFMLLFQRHILMMQFTIVAAFFAMASIACLLEIRRINYYNELHKKFYIILFWFFVFLSYATRKKVFLMALPIILVIFVVILIENWHRKKLVISLIIGVICICGSLTLFTNVVYNSGELYAYTQFNIARSKVLDYKGLPDYYENEEFYQEIGMSEAVYTALGERNFDVDDSISTDNLNEIKKYSDLIDADSLVNKIFMATNQVFEELFANETLYTSLGILFMLFLLTPKTKKSKQYLEIILSCMFPLYIMLGILGLILYGRIMERLIEAMGLFYAGGFWGNVFLMNETLEKENYQKNHLLLPTLIRNCTLIILISICLLANQYQLQRNDSGLRATITKKTEELNAVKAYALSHPDKFYFYNSLDFIASSDFVFYKNSHKFLNMESLGNWYSKSPLYYERNEKIGFASAIDGLLNNKNVYYVERGEYHSSLNQLLVENGKYFEKVDSIIANDTEINIYKVTDITNE